MQLGSSKNNNAFFNRITPKGLWWFKIPTDLVWLPTTRITTRLIQLFMARAAHTAMICLTSHHVTRSMRAFISSRIQCFLTTQDKFAKFLPGERQQMQLLQFKQSWATWRHQNIGQRLRKTSQKWTESPSRRWIWCICWCRRFHDALRPSASRRKSSMTT